MKRINRFIFTVALGGFLVILPLLVLYKLFVWLVAVFSDTVQPWTGVLMRYLDINQTNAEIVIFLLLFAFCFMLGAFIRTKLGFWIHGFFERIILARIPGYVTVKDIIGQFTGGSQGMFRKVVTVSIADKPDSPRFTGFVTSEYGDSGVTVFIPTGPNPTTGLVLHTTRDRLVELDVSVESAMKTIISCGAGSGDLLRSLKIV